MVSRGIFESRPVLGRHRRPSRPPVSKRFSHLCTHLSDRIGLAAVSLMLSSCARGPCGWQAFWAPSWNPSLSCMLSLDLPALFCPYRISMGGAHYWFQFRGFSLNKLLVGAIEPLLLYLASTNFTSTLDIVLVGRPPCRSLAASRHSCTWPRGIAHDVH